MRGPERCHGGHFWVLVAPGNYVLFQFSQRHDARAVDRLLDGYEGYLVADVHLVYDRLYRPGKMIGVGCWAHNRRDFFAAREAELERAHWSEPATCSCSSAAARVNRIGRQPLR